MRVLFDTSVLVAALVEAHDRHARAFPWLQRARAAEVQGLIAMHSMAETCAVLASLPLSPCIAPVAAWTLLEHSVLAFMQSVDLTADDVRQVLARLSRQGLAGGVVYDALIAAAVLAAGAECILTLNPGDFRRVLPAGTLDVREP